MDEDSLSDRTQTEQGVFDGKIVLLDFKATVSKTMSYEQRQKRWKAKSVEEKNAKFNKLFQPQNTKKWPSTMKSQPIESVVFFKNPVKGRFGMPLKKFPEQKHDHSKIVVRKKANGVDYSIDEHDITWLTAMNRNRNGQEFFSVAIYEHWLDRLEKWSVWKPREHHKLRDEHGKELDDVCNICLDGDTSNCNQIVYCDRCNLTVHQDCYGIPFIPEGCLECRRCVVSPARRVSCVLCPSRTGAFKQVDHKRWVHVLCVIWVDETHFGNTIFMENVQNIERALHDRKALSCMLCKVHNPKHAKHGACIQCSEAKCTASFHVTCARNHGFTMRIFENDNGSVNRYVWCPKHQPEQTEADKEQHQRMLRNKRRENEKMLKQISMPTLTKSIISRIRSERPFRDFRDIVLFWYQKRQNRLGAPLLKGFSPEDVAEAILMSSQTTPRRGRALEGSSATVEEIEDSDDEEEEDSDEDMDEEAEELKRQHLAQNSELLEMIMSKEEQKKEKILDTISSIQLLTKSLRTVPILLEETLEKLKAKDASNIFADPVEVPGYKELIKNPICLRDMTDKMRAKKYKSISQLTADVTLMLQNCAQFNVKNKYFLNYGSTFKRQTTPILEAAAREESEMTSSNLDKNSKEELMKRFMEPYDKWMMPSESTTSSGGGRRGRRKKEIPKIEDVKMEEVPIVKIKEEPVDEEMLPPRRGRKRVNLETMTDSDNDGGGQKASGASTSSRRDSGAPGASTSSKRDSGPSTSSGAPSEPSTSSKRDSEAPGTNGFFKKSTLKSPGFPEPHRKRNFPPSESSKIQNPSGPQKQTKMTSFFTPSVQMTSSTSGVPQKPQVTFAEDTVGGNGAQGAGDKKNALPPPQPRFQQPQLPSSFTTSKLFPATSSAFFTSYATAPPLLRITRSSAPSLTPTVSAASTSSAPPAGGGGTTRRQTFRISSSNIQSPNPEPRRRGRNAFKSDGDDDDEEEIQIQPAPVQLSPEELRMEKLRSAENEARSKFAHNQLVIVDGRAAKVIEVQLAHLSDIHTEQRQSMMKKRREVLSEIPQAAMIYVEFFQKSNTLENYQWVEPAKVELLDLNTVAQKGVKIPGLKAAREWHQKVINGDV